MIEISNWSQLTQHPQQTKDRMLKNKQKKQLTSSRKKMATEKKSLNTPIPLRNMLNLIILDCHQNIQYVHYEAS